jgi:hypothetical protein
VVVDDLDLFRTFAGPHEAHPPLIVEADAVLALAVSLQGFELNAERRAQIVQYRRTILTYLPS